MHLYLAGTQSCSQIIFINSIHVDSASINHRLITPSTMPYEWSSRPHITVPDEERGRRSSWRDKLRMLSRSRESSKRLVLPMNLPVHIGLIVKETVLHLYTSSARLPSRRPRHLSRRKSAKSMTMFMPRTYLLSLKTISLRLDLQTCGAPHTVRQSVVMGKK